MANKTNESTPLTAARFASIVRESCKNGQRFCFILGSGASAASGIPSGQALEMKWMDCLMGIADDGNALRMDPKETEETAARLFKDKQILNSFDDIKKAWEEAKKPGGKSISSEYYFDIYKLRFYPENRNGFKYLASMMEKCEPSVGYHPLARMLAEVKGIDLVITTNFDSLTEDALFIYTDERPIVIDHEALVEYLELDNRQRPIVAKVHRGLFYEPKNDKKSTNGLSPEWKAALDIIFSQYTPIVIGYAGGDKSLMSYLEDSKTRINGGIYWCHLKNHAPDRKIEKLVRNKRGHFVKINGFDDIMLTLGQVFFNESLIPTNTKAHLSESAQKRYSRYDAQWTKWAVEDESEHDSAITKLIDAENEKELEREKANELTEEDHFRRMLRASNAHNAKPAIKEATYLIDCKHRSMELALIIRGLNYRNLEDNENAIADFTHAISLTPDGLKNEVLFLERGRTYFIEKKFAETVQDISEVLRLNAKNAIALVLRGGAHFNLGEYEEAIADFTEALSIDPKNAEVLRFRGGAHFSLGEYEEAIADFTEALSIDPQNAEVLSSRGGAHLNLKEYKEAIADYTEALSIDPQNAEALVLRGGAHFSLGEYEEAIADFTELIKLKHDDPTGYIERSFSYYRNGKYNEAFEDAEKALVLGGEHPYAYCNRGIARNKLGEHEQAIEDLTRCLELLPENEFDNQALGRRYRAEAYRALGMEKEAQENEKQAEEIEKNRS